LKEGSLLVFEAVFNYLGGILGMDEVFEFGEHFFVVDYVEIGKVDCCVPSGFY